MYAVTFALLSPRRSRISKVSSSEYKNTLSTDYVSLKKIDCDLFYFFDCNAFVLLLSFVSFLLLNVANVITDGNPLKVKLGISIEQQGAISRDVEAVIFQSLPLPLPLPHLSLPLPLPLPPLPLPLSKND